MSNINNQDHMVLSSPAQHSTSISQQNLGSLPNAAHVSSSHAAGYSSHTDMQISSPILGTSTTNNTTHHRSPSFNARHNASSSSTVPPLSIHPTNQSVPPSISSSAPPPRVSRPSSERMVIKLTTHLMNTYNGINEKYYANKRKKLQEQQNRMAGNPKAVYNNGYDDKDYNYIVQQSEKLKDRYIVDHSIGKGSFGRVVKAYDTLKKVFVAVKIVKSKSAFHRQAQVEMKILSSLQDQADKWNIVTVIDQFMHRNHQCIVFELLSLNLYELLRNTRFQGVSLKLIAKFGQQLLCTLGYLSSKERGEQRIIHCDLKPENILLRNCKKSTIKVIDFGSACFANQKTYTYIQSRFYRAPEVLLNLPYNWAIDMWSLGCILVEMHTGKPLFDGLDEADQLMKQVDILGMPPRAMLDNNQKAEKFFDLIGDTSISSGEWKLKAKYTVNNPPLGLRHALGARWSDAPLYIEFEDLIMKMLKYSPKDRIRPSQALGHPFFQLVAQLLAAQNAEAAKATASSSSSTTATPSTLPTPTSSSTNPSTTSNPPSPHSTSSSGLPSSTAAYRTWPKLGEIVAAGPQSMAISPSSSSNNSTSVQPTSSSSSSNPPVTAAAVAAGKFGSSSQAALQLQSQLHSSSTARQNTDLSPLNRVQRQLPLQNEDSKMNPEQSKFTLPNPRKRPHSNPFPFTPSAEGQIAQHESTTTTTNQQPQQSQTEESEQQLHPSSPSQKAQNSDDVMNDDPDSSGSRIHGMKTRSAAKEGNFPHSLNAGATNPATYSTSSSGASSSRSSPIPSDPNCHPRRDSHDHPHIPPQPLDQEDEWAKSKEHSEGEDAPSSGKKRGKKILPPVLGMAGPRQQLSMMSLQAGSDSSPSIQPLGVSVPFSGLALNHLPSANSNNSLEEDCVGHRTRSHKA